MKDWLYLYFKEVIEGVDKPEDMEIQRLEGAMVSVFKVSLPNLDILNDYPRFLKTAQGVVAAAGHKENRRYVLELEEKVAS